MKKKTLSMLIVLVLVLIVGVGGTLAWLKDKTDTVTNTFSPSNIDITLTESATNDGDEDPNTNAYEMVPGKANPKDPKVTVDATSEPCWVFVKVEETNNVISNDPVKKYLLYSIDTTVWTALDNVDGVYYKKVDSPDETPYFVLKDNKVTTNPEVTKAEMEALDKADKYPNIKFTAYAIQQEGFANAAAAWVEASAQQ